jgi:hypothetical protein
MVRAPGDDTGPSRRGDFTAPDQKVSVNILKHVLTENRFPLFLDML